MTVSPALLVLLSRKVSHLFSAWSRCLSPCPLLKVLLHESALRLLRSEARTQGLPTPQMSSPRHQHSGPVQRRLIHLHAEPNDRQQKCCAQYRICFIQYRKPLRIQRDRRTKQHSKTKSAPDPRHNEYEPENKSPALRRKPPFRRPSRREVGKRSAQRRFITTHPRHSTPAALISNAAVPISMVCFAFYRIHRW